MPYLQHLDEGNTQVEISHVTADQTQTEHKTDGNDSAKVDTAGHLDGLAAVQNVGGTGKDLGHNGREGQVPCCEDNGEAEVGVVEEVLVEQNDTGAQSDPGTVPESVVVVSFPPSVSPALDSHLT